MGLFSGLFGKAKYNSISVSELGEELKSKKGKQFVDVRTKAEFKENHIRDFDNMPLQNLANNLNKLDKTKPVYVICRSGGRSSSACGLLSKSGFENVYNVKGGMMAWESQK